MTVVSSAAAHKPAASRAAAQERRIARAIDNFAKPFRPVIKLLAAGDPRLGDLALSFPALLFVIAVPHKGRDADGLRAGVLAGLTLKTLAKMAGLPLWLRKLPPWGFTGEIGPLPENPFVLAQMSHHVPTRKHEAENWLHHISLACRWGTDSFALWIAARPFKERGGLNAFAIQKLAMFAWFSEHPELALGREDKKMWHNKLDVKGALRRWDEWTARVNLRLYIDTARRDPRLQPVHREGFDFVHLGTSELIAEEAVRMSNCIMGYGNGIAEHGTELWSMRKGGKSFATLSVEANGDDGLAHISEIKGPGNKPVTRDVALAARRWFQSHDIESISPIEIAKAPVKRVTVWQSLFKPYWMAKQALPPWMSFAPEDCYLGSIYWAPRRRRRWRRRRRA